MLVSGVQHNGSMFVHMYFKMITTISPVDLHHHDSYKTFFFRGQLSRSTLVDTFKYAVQYLTTVTTLYITSHDLFIATTNLFPMSMGLIFRVFLFFCLFVLLFYIPHISDITQYLFSV